MADTGTFGERFPEWGALPTHQLLARIPNDAFHSLIPVIAEWYESHLPLYLVLQHFGYDGSRPSGPRDPRLPLIDASVDELQVSCRLPSHYKNLEKSGLDLKPSARYYRFDRNKNTALGHIFCHAASCYKAYTSFWYLYVQLKHSIEADFREAIRYVESTWRLPFPRHIVLMADPSRLDHASRQMAAQREIAQRMIQARLLREKYMAGEIGREQHLGALSILHTQPLMCMEVPSS